MNNGINNLKGSDLVVFTLLSQDCRVKVSQIVSQTCYHPDTIYSALKRLDTSYRLITRRRERRGQRYQFSVIESNN